MCGCAQHTHILCGCAHSVRRGCARHFYRECAVCVRMAKYQVCGVRKMAVHKNLVISMICIIFSSENHSLGAFEFEIELSFKLKLFIVSNNFYCQFRCDLRPHKYTIQSELFLCSHWSVWAWVRQKFKKLTCAVRDCAGWKAIVCRVCGCAKIGCTQILCRFVNLRLAVRFLDCAIITTDPIGVITSPGYPHPYRNGIDCTWLIQLQLGQLIAINFQEFVLAL